MADEAVDLGKAMQLTNIARDVREDFETEQFIFLSTGFMRRVLVHPKCGILNTDRNCFPLFFI